MGTLDLRKTALIAQRERLLRSIRECEDKISRVKERQHYMVFSSGSSSDDEDPLAESRALSQVPSSGHREQQAELAALQTNIQATEELSSVTVVESKVTKLFGPPADLDLDDEELPHGEWSRHEARCSMVGAVPFAVSFLLHAAPSSHHRFHDTRLRILKRSLEAEYRPLVEPMLSPSTELVRLRSFSRVVTARRRTLRSLIERMGEDLVIEEAEEGGVKMVEQRDKLEVFWTFQLENPHGHVFINKLEVTYAAELEAGKRAAIQELVDSLAEAHLPTSEQGALMLRLVRVMRPGDGTGTGGGTAPMEETEQASETEDIETETDDQRTVVPHGKSPIAGPSGERPPSRIPVQRK